MPISIDLHGYDKKVKACYKRALTCEQLANSEGSKCEQTNSDFGTLKRIADLYEEAANNIQQMIDLIQKDPVPNEIAIWLCEVRAKQYHCLGDHAYFISKDFPGYISYHEKSADAMQQALSLLPESKDAKQQRLYYSGMMYYVMADAQDGKATLAEQEGKFRRAVVEREKQKDFIEKEFEFFKDIVPKERIYHHISRFWIAEYSRLICMAKISESDSNFDQTLEYLQESAQAAERARQASPDWPPYGQMCRQTQLIIDEFLDNHPELAEKESIDALLIKSIGKKGEENEKALSKVISSLEEKELKSRKSQIPRCYKIGTSFCPYRLEETSAQVFIGMPFRSHYENVYKFAIEPALMSVGLAPWKANQAISNIDIMCKMCHAIQQSAYSIIDISDWNPNVMFELGLVYALHKRTLLIKQQHANVPVDLSGMEVINYSRFENLGEKVRTFFEETLKKNEVATWGCFKMGFLDCPMNLENDPQKVFLAMPFRDEQQNMYLFALKPAMERLGLRIWKADEELNNVDFICKLCHAIRTSSFGIVDITGWNPNVMFELGLLYGYGKKVALINKAGEKVPVDLHGLEYVEYNDYGALSQKIEDFFVSSLKTNQ